MLAKRPSPLLVGLPLTISVGQALSNLAAAQRPVRRRPTIAAGGPPPDVTALPLRSPMLSTPPDADPLHTSTPGASSGTGEEGSSVGDAEGAPRPGALLRLRCTEIRPYDRNPRTLPNEHREDIRQGLLASGQQGALTVTRRHPGAPYMLAAGANTTLMLLQELYRETGEARFEWVRCLYQPYDSEARLLAQHLGENLNRGDMKFWEVAQGMVQLLAAIDDERRQADPAARPMGSREASEQLSARGLRADKSGIATWRFAVQRLHGLGPLTRWLSRLNVRESLMPRLNALCVLASRFGLPAEVYWTEVVTPTLEVEALAHAQAMSLDAPAFCDQIEQALARRLDESITVVRQMLSILKLNPSATLADLRQPSPNLVVGPRPSTAASAPAPFDDDEADGDSAAATRGAGTMSGPVAVADGAADAAPRDGDDAGLGVGKDPAPQDAGGARLPALQPATDPQTLLPRLHAAVQAVLDAHGLGACLRWQDAMPLGYALVRPDASRIAAGLGQRAAQRLVWWHLHLMATPGLQHETSEAGSDTTPSLGAAPPATVEWLMACLLPGPLQPVLQSLRDVERLASAVLAGAPVRSEQLRLLAIEAAVA